jgi:flagellar motor switch protein FliM
MTNLDDSARKTPAPAAEQEPPESDRGEPASPDGVEPFDFRHSNRLPNSQLSLIHVLHDSFVRMLTSSLSLTLRSFVSGNVVSVDQLSYSEFSARMQSPTCIVYLSMLPYEGYAAVEVNHALIAPILDHVLGGNGKIDSELDREITDIEKGMLEGFFRIIPHDLTEAWRPIASIGFAFDCVETEPLLSNRISRNEAVVVIAMELRIGDKVGKVNLAVPSITLKMLRHKFDQQSTTKRAVSPENEAAIKHRLSDTLKFDVDCALVGPRIRLTDLLGLKAGDLVDLGVEFDRKGSILINGVPKFRGEVIVEGSKQALVIESVQIN